MSQNNVEDVETKDPENEQVKYPLTYPEDDWFFVTMIVICVATLIGYTYLHFFHIP